MAKTAQDEVVAFLSRAEAYGDVGTKVERKETQISLVFLAGDYAYKLPRAIRLSFLDFTPLEERRRVCEAGLKLNSRTAPGMYHACWPVTREASGALALNGSGTPLDYVLVMRRFDQELIFDRLLKAERLTPELLDRLAARIHAFHEAEEPIIEGDLGGPGALRRVLDSNIEEIESFPRLFPRDAAAALHTRLGRALDDAAPQLARRKAEGQVRHCHGDLHLRNIVLWEGAPRLFDCLEFDAAMATIDVLYDLAFLVMDLDARGRRDLANRVLGRSLLLSGDYGGLAVLPLFLALRSHIRAFVAAGGAAVAQEPQEKQRLEEEASDYFERAGGYLDPPPPRLIAVGGLSGSGKSTLAGALAPEIGAAPGALHLRSDLLRKQLAGVSDSERLPASAYSQASSDEVYAELRRRAGAALAAGHSVILDAVHAKPEERAAAEAVAREAGAAFTGIWLEAPRQTLLDRVEARRGDASDATPQVVARQLGYDLGEISWRCLAAGGGLRATLRRARACLLENQD
ncbi:MAG: AAA family ATPase [Rhodovibrionaceae bacterium]